MSYSKAVRFVFVLPKRIKTPNGRLAAILPVALVLALQLTATASASSASRRCESRVIKAATAYVSCTAKEAARDAAGSCAGCKDLSAKASHCAQKLEKQIAKARSRWRTACPDLEETGEGGTNFVDQLTERAEELENVAGVRTQPVSSDAALCSLKTVNRTGRYLSSRAHAAARAVSRQRLPKSADRLDAKFTSQLDSIRSRYESACAEVGSPDTLISLSEEILTEVVQAAMSPRDGGTVVLMANGTALGLDSKGEIRNEVPDYYDFSHQACTSTNPPSNQYWLKVYIGATTVSAGESFLRATADVILPKPPRGAGSIPFKYELWLGPQPAPVPDSQLDEMGCVEYPGCDYCTYNSPKAGLYNSGAFLHMVNGANMSLNVFPDREQPLSRKVWWVIPSFEAGGVNVLFKGFHAPPGATIRTEFSPADEYFWSLSGRSMPPALEEQTKVVFDNQIMLGGYLDKLVDAGAIDPDDPQIAKAEANTWKWLLVPYQVSTIYEKPEKVEDLPKFFADLTEWKNIVVEEQGNEQVFSTFFDFVTGMEINGRLVGLNNFISYEVFQDYLDAYDKSSEDYPYLNCLGAILTRNLEGSSATPNFDGSLDFAIPAGSSRKPPKECTGRYYGE